MVKIKVDVSGIESTLNEIERDLHRGMEKSTDNLVDNARDHARKVISEEDAIFNSEVYAGFRDAETRNSTYTVRAKLYNNVEHADVLEEGAKFPAEGPPVEALLPWVVRKMNWRPDGGLDFDNDDGGRPDSFDDDDSGGDGEDTSIDRSSPDEDNPENWNDLSRDYSEAKEIPENAILKNTYANAPVRRFDDGIYFGWNEDKYQIRPTSSGFEHYTLRKGEYEYVGTTDSANYYVPDEADQVLGYKRATDDDFNYDIYRPRDLPTGITQDFYRNDWNDLEDFENKVGRELAYRDNYGIIHEGEVLKVDDDGSVTLVDNETNQTTEWLPDLNQTEIVAVETVDFEKNNPLFNVEKEDVRVGEKVYASSSKYRRLEISEKKGTTFIGTDDNGSAFELEYDRIVSRLEHGPVSNRIDEWETGDRVTFYDEDDDEFIDIILTGNRDFSGERFEAIHPQTKDPMGEIPQALFVEWESAPNIDETKITPSMRRVTIGSSEVGKDELSYTDQDVVLYHPIEGETRSATVTSPPWNDNYEVTLSNGDVIDIDSDDWQIRAGVDFKTLSDTDQKNAIADHFENSVDISGADSEDIDYYKKALKDSIHENYSDDDKLAQTVFSLTETAVNDNRAHAANTASNDGWSLQMKPKPNTDSNMLVRDWYQTFDHEFGHGYSKPTVGGTSAYRKDPKEYDFSGPWGKKDDPDYDHMYVADLPKWEFGSNSPMHGYKEMYMFTPGDGKMQISYNSDGDIQLDSRNSMNPYGFDEWGDRVREKAIADAEGTTLAQKEMSTNIRELDDKQVFGSIDEDFAIDEGDYVAFDVDGETVIHEYTGREGMSTNFSQNSDEDVPTSGESVTFETLDGDYNYFYVGSDGNVYDTEYTDNGTTVLTKKNDTFIGTATISNYDPSLNEFPDLTETENIERMQEAANMAWWYQAIHIEHDTSTDKERSKEIVLSGGYSSTYAEEVMSTFTEAIAHPDPPYQAMEDLEMIIERYPFFIEQVLKERKPVSNRVEQELKEEGFL